MTDEPLDPDVEASLAELDNFLKSWDPRQQPSEDEIAEEADSILDLVIPEGPPPVALQAAEAARRYVFNRDRSQLIRDLERACPLAESINGPVVTNLLREALTHLRRPADGDGLP
jgi:hypothetical protein